MSQQTEQIEKQLDELRRKVTGLEVALAETRQHEPWEARRFYTAYYATTGFMLGMFGALTSLVFNVVGSLLVGQHPLRLIQVYLTFPLGERALAMDTASELTLAVGCCLYIATGMVLGIPFQLAMARWQPDSLPGRLILGSVLATGIWLINFYGILVWLQPLLFEGNWIVDLIPWWVGLLTHLVFGWTMAVVYPLGAYSPYRLQTEKS